MDTTQDPAILAADTLARADADLDSAYESYDEEMACAACAQAATLDYAFTIAIPTTVAGVRCKVDDMLKLLRIYEGPEDEETMTREGAAGLCRHLESIMAGLARPRLTAL